MNKLHVSQKDYVDKSDLYQFVSFALQMGLVSEKLKSFEASCDFVFILVDAFKRFHKDNKVEIL